MVLTHIPLPSPSTQFDKMAIFLNRIINRDGGLPWGPIGSSPGIGTSASTSLQQVWPLVTFVIKYITRSSLQQVWPLGTFVIRCITNTTRPGPEGGPSLELNSIVLQR